MAEEYVEDYEVEELVADEGPAPADKPVQKTISKQPADVAKAVLSNACWSLV